MRIAALYDIHGNLPAMEAALQACRGEGVAAVVIGGDIAAGPLPSDTLDVLMALGPWAVPIQGPLDRAVVSAYDLLMAGKRQELASCDPIAAWAAGRITARHRDFLAGLPQEVVLPASELGDIRFCRQSAGDGADSQAAEEEALRSLLARHPERTLVCGGTHRAALRKEDGKTLVDPGSVGLPEDDAPGAYWAVFGPDIALRRTDYNLRSAARRIGRSGMPDARAFAQTFVLKQA